MKFYTKISLILCSCLAGCHFSPLYGEHTINGVCVLPIPEASGAAIYRQLKQHFPDTGPCQYTLKVSPPQTILADQGISDKDFITMQQVRSVVSYTLLGSDKQTVLQNQLTTTGSSSIVANPYATVVATEKTEANINTILAEQIALHVAAFLDRTQK